MRMQQVGDAAEAMREAVARVPPCAFLRLQQLRTYVLGVVIVGIVVALCGTVVLGFLFFFFVVVLLLLLAFVVVVVAVVAVGVGIRR